MESHRIQMGQVSGLASYAPQVEAMLADLTKRDAASRIWAKDLSLWKS